MSPPMVPYAHRAPRGPVYRRNGKIRAREVRVIDEDKQQLGVMSLSDALRLARSRYLDLVEVAPNATPPVCRLIDYGKFLYEDAKREKSARAHQSASRMKEVQLSPSIDPHDLAVKLNRAIEFLCDDVKVRLKLRFRGRQKAHKEIGFDLVNKFLQDLAEYGHADAPPKMLGDRDLNVLISPLPRSKRAKKPTHAPAPAAAQEVNVPGEGSSGEAH